MEIAVTDMERAIKFYETVFGFKLERHRMGELDMVWFPSIEAAMGSSGALVKNDKWYKPTLDGSLIYFTAFSGDLNNELVKVDGAGGKIYIPRKQISSEVGFMAVVGDTEGNRLAIHSRK